MRPPEDPVRAGGVWGFLISLFGYIRIRTRSPSAVHQPNDPRGNHERRTVPYRCYTQEDEIEIRPEFATFAGYVGKGEKLLPRWTPGSIVYFVFLSNTFPNEVDARTVETAFMRAVDDWNSKAVGVQLQRVFDCERAAFVVAYEASKAKPRAYASAFFPDSDDRTLRVFSDALSVDSTVRLLVILLHEIGHVLGLRHENASTTEPEKPSVELTSFNEHSIMMAPLPEGSGTCIHDRDVEALKMLYSMADNSTFKDYRVVTVDPATPVQLRFKCWEQTLHGDIASAFASRTEMERVTIPGLIMSFLYFLSYLIMFLFHLIVKWISEAMA